MAVINDRLVRSFESGNLILMDEGGEKFVGKKKKEKKRNNNGLCRVIMNSDREIR